uniref:Uncharacterized protein n=1 Tax=Amphimedon queenslandica TaxID=400682 RepID=A0A1X7TWH9_AMPQE
MLRRNIDVTVGLVNGAIGTGLSLDTAIIDLSTDIFGDGMAYVALCRVRKLNGSHLLSFDPLSVKVSSPCIDKINCLRSKFRNDLPQIKKSKGKKRKIQVTGIIDDGEPCSKNAKVSVSHVQSTSNSTVSSNKQPPNPDIVRRQWDYVYYPGNEEFQRTWCEILNLKFFC